MRYGLPKKNRRGRVAGVIFAVLFILALGLWERWSDGFSVNWDYGERSIVGFEVSVLGENPPDREAGQSHSELTVTGTGNTPQSTRGRGLAELGWDAQELRRWTERLDYQQDITILDNIGYQVAYSEKYKNPLLVRYLLDNDYSVDAIMKRPDEPWSIDNRTSSQVSPDAFRGSGYQRGHMAPSFAIGKFYGREAQLETFRMSNITPQTEKQNAGVWNTLERLEVDQLVSRFRGIEVACGPVFDGSETMIGDGFLAAKMHYKAILRPDGEVLAFLIPADPLSENIEAYLVTPAEVEAATGLTLFPGRMTSEARHRAPQRLW